jgi:hypothetical protein
VIGLCALGYKANVEARPVLYAMTDTHVGVTYDAGPIALTLPPSEEARIHRIIRDASGTPISATPIVLGDAWANAATHPWSEDQTTDTAVR